MKDLTLIDIEEKIYNQLNKCCDMDQEAIDYLKYNIKKAETFGVDEEKEIIDRANSFIHEIATLVPVSSFSLINKIIEIFTKINLYSLKKHYRSSIFSKLSLGSFFNFTSPILQQEKNLKKLEFVYNDIIDHRGEIYSNFLFFDNMQKEHIFLLEKIDKQILLGKCIISHLYKNFPDFPKEIAIMQRRVFEMEISKNIPLQIISKIQNMEEMISNILNLIDKNLYIDISSYVKNYRQTICSLKQCLKNPNLRIKLEKSSISQLEDLKILHQNILCDIKTLEILDEDMEDKVQELKSSLPLLLK